MSARGGPQPAIDLDHVGIGVDSVQAPLQRVVDDLGATVIYGGYVPGCRYVVSRVGDEHEGMDLELLEPWDDGHDFLSRFLSRRGAGPHHITFMVRDVDHVLDRLAADDLRPVIQRLDNPVWREAFLSPKEMGGIVVQVGETNTIRSDEAFSRARADEPLGRCSIAHRGWPPSEPGWWSWPGERTAPTSYLRKVVLPSEDLEHNAHVYAGLLGGKIVERSATALELEWPRGGRLRFVLQSPEAVHLALSNLPEGMDTLAGARLADADG